MLRACSIAVVLGATAALAGVSTPGEARASEPAARTLGAWAPDVAAARAFARTRTGSVSFAVRTAGRFWGHRTTRAVPSASVVKAMLMVAYLRREGVRSRQLHRDERRRLLAPMVRESGNVAATRVRDLVGNSALRRLGRVAGMRRFATAPSWGSSVIDARDQTRFFLRIDRLVPPRHRSYAMSLLSGIVPAQRWGIGEVTPAGWRAYFKGGWGDGDGEVDHQVALLRRGSLRVAIAVLTTGNAGHDDGKRTLRGVFARLTRGLAEVAPAR